jgi:Xaa-Pro dipeptidase
MSSDEALDDYPRWSDRELHRRRATVLAEMDAAEVSRLVAYEANRSGTAIQWLTGWPVTREALLVVEHGHRDVLFVQFYNHVPNAERIATGADVRWGGTSTVGAAVDLFAARGGDGERVGVIGSLPFASARVLAERVGPIVDMSGAYTRMRLVKSNEELDRLRAGVEMTDRAIDALLTQARPGLDERELGDIVERAYLADGGVNHIHYFAATQMTNPDVAVPAQWPSARRLRAGDVLVAEVSASWWDYPGQVLRTFGIEADPTPLYRDLHDAAEAAFEAITARLAPGVSGGELLDAARLIEDAGFTTRDDLVHGFVGGYLPPVLSGGARTAAGGPDFVFAEGMTVVVQPNVITTDESAGVQTGELLLVTASGCTPLHAAPRGWLRIG